MKQPALWSLVMILALTSVIACNKKDDNKPQTVYTKSGLLITNSQEVSATPSDASGTMNVSYDKTTKMLTLSATWANLSSDPVAAHIHGPAPRGQNAGVKVDFHDNVSTASGTFNRIITVDESSIKEDSLLKGFYYLNIHTPANPGGEIRGQIEF
ncbi:MAG TPA: CHRD domain-containing protein [Flavitalea sp.]|nr:CHRD domain-containing protein [Flavitalea sp.]